MGTAHLHKHHLHTTYIPTCNSILSPCDQHTFTSPNLLFPNFQQTLVKTSDTNLLALDPDVFLQILNDAWRIDEIMKLEIVCKRFKEIVRYVLSKLRVLRLYEYSYNKLDYLARLTLSLGELHTSIAPSAVIYFLQRHPNRDDVIVFPQHTSPVLIRNIPQNLGEVLISPDIPEGLSAIQDLTNLRVLLLVKVNLPHSVLQLNCPLTRLWLDECTAPNFGIEIILQYPELLKTLKLSFNECLAKFPQASELYLEKLKLIGTEIEASLISSMNTKYLKYFGLIDAVLYQPTLLLTMLNRLESTDVRLDTDIKFSSLIDLPDFKGPIKSVRYLVARSVDSIPDIFPNLEVLVFKSADIPTLPWDHQIMLHKVTRLELTDVEVHSQTVPAIMRHLPSLVTVRLVDSNVDRLIIDGNAREIFIKRCSINIIEVANAPQLEMLQVTGPIQINDIVFHSFSCPQLRSVEISVPLHRMIQGIELGCPKLKRLHLPQLALSTSFMDTIGTALQRHIVCHITDTIREDIVEELDRFVKEYFSFHKRTLVQKFVTHRIVLSDRHKPKVPKLFAPVALSVDSTTKYHILTDIIPLMLTSSYELASVQEWCNPIYPSVLHILSRRIDFS